VNARFGGKGARILDFDCECRPLAWYGGDFVTKQPTLIAWKFIGEPGPTSVAWIGGSGDNERVLLEERWMLADFRRAYDEADIVTGHYIRGFDLPLLNGALMRLGAPGLSPKMSQDTKLDMVKRQGLSTSQENLGAMLGLSHDKVGMNTGKWADANMLLLEGIMLAKERVVGDVEQHIEMRQRMLDLGILGPPKLWSPSAKGSGKYHA